MVKKAAEKVPKKVHRQRRVDAGDESEEKQTVGNRLDRAQHRSNDLLEDRKVFEEADRTEDPDGSEWVEDGHVAVEGGGNAAGDGDQVKNVPSVVEEGEKPVGDEIYGNLEAENSGEDVVQQVKVSDVVLVGAAYLCCKDADDKAQEDAQRYDLLKRSRPASYQRVNKPLPICKLSAAHIILMMGVLISGTGTFVLAVKRSGKVI
eukprot:753530-Hanusia_phi.AAC.2